MGSAQLGEVEEKEIKELTGNGYVSQQELYDMEQAELTPEFAEGVKTPQNEIYKARIEGKQNEIATLKLEIEAIARGVIADYNPARHAVAPMCCFSSPIGLCVYIIDSDGLWVNCKYCGKPASK